MDIWNPNVVGMDAHRNDDDESYTDSVTNGSWTGRMRARKAMEEPKPSDKVDQRLDPRFGSASTRNVAKNNDEGMSVADRVFNSVQGQQQAAMSDAQEGFKKFAKDDPNSTAIGLGVAGALCGALVLGPIGFVLGAASVGVGYKVTQMPEKDRTEVKSKAATAMQQFQESAVAAHESLSNSCAAACGPSQKDDDVSADNAKMMARGSGAQYGVPVPSGTSPIREMNPMGMNLKVSNMNPMPQDLQKGIEEKAKVIRTVRQIRRITAACRRMGRITPVGQIHSLDPALHPRAWLDVMASAWTSRDEKNEAMEEVLLLAKDKVRC